MRLLGLAICVVSASLLMVSPAHALGKSAPASLAPPKADILVDADSGAVLDQLNDHVPLPPASLTKLLTAVVAAQTLQPADPIPVSARAAGEPAAKIAMKPGQIWPFNDALHALLLSSANDAAVAIGERIGGNLESFAKIFTAAGQQEGLQDTPVLQDPAGLDDNFSVNGGNLLSARDLAIIARAALAQPTVAAVVATDRYLFVGPDGAHHELTNHNARFLRSYPGAIGMKTGFTRKAGSGLVLAARRDGRTLIAVVLDGPNAYGLATGLLDRGFALPQGAIATGAADILPPVHLPANALAPAPPPPTQAQATPTPVPPPSTSGAQFIPPPGQHPGGLTHALVRAAPAVIVLILLGVVALLVVARRREIRRRRRQRQRRQHLARHSQPRQPARPGSGVGARPANELERSPWMDWEDRPRASGGER